MWRAAALAGLTLLPLAACAPVPVAEAERMCVEDANLARRPRGHAAIGIGTGGKAVGDLDVTVSTDFLTGRDPAAVFNSCVKARSGQFPTRPIYDQPGWVG